MNKYLYHVISCFILFVFASCGTQNNTPLIYNNQKVTINTDELEIVSTSSIKVHDGDTIEIDLDGESTKIRLIGIDAFETTTRFNKAHKQAIEYGFDNVEEVLQKGEEAKEFLERLLKDKTQLFLEYDEEKIDKYGRILAYVWISDTQMINMQIACSGYATILTIKPNDKYKDKFETCFEFAQQKDLGIWEK